MTREEEIRQEMSKITGTHPDWNKNDCMRMGFYEGAKWADKTMIDKAEKWLENFLEKTIQKPSINDGYTSDTIDLAESRRHRLIEEVLYDFKKTMEK